MSDVPKVLPPGIKIDKETGVATFDYIKSSSFRVISVDGLFGGINPRGNVTVALFNERWPIPQKMTYHFDPKTGKVGDEIREQRVARDSVVREVEVLLVMDKNVAKSMRDWLNEKLKEFDAIEKAKDTENTPQ